MPITFPTFSITKFFFFPLSQTIIFKFHFPCFPPKKMLLICSVFSCEPFTATKINKTIKLKKKKKTIYSYPYPRFHPCTNPGTNLKIKLPIIINQLALSNLAVTILSEGWPSLASRPIFNANSNKIKNI